MAITFKVPFEDELRVTVQHRRFFRNAKIAYEKSMEGIKAAEIAEELLLSTGYISQLAAWYNKYLDFHVEKNKPQVVVPPPVPVPEKKPDPIGVADIGIVAYLALNEIHPINMQPPAEGGFRYLWLFDDSEKVNDRIKQYFEMSDRIFPIQFSAEMRRLQKELKAFRDGMHHTFKNPNYADEEHNGRA